jgi:hypothetical protein
VDAIADAMPAALADEWAVYAAIHAEDEEEAYENARSSR